MIWKATRDPAGGHAAPRRGGPVALFAGALAVGLTLASSALAEAYQCQFGQSQRRVELRFADQPDRLPCEVLYWRDLRRSDEPRRLWYAESDHAFCVRKTEELLAELRGGGWRCEAVDDGAGTAATRSGEVQPNGTDAAARAGERPPERPTATAPAVDTQSDRRRRLQDAITRDLGRLNEITAGATGRFEIGMAEMGDLDRDGEADAAAIMTYRAGPELAHYLVAYVFDGAVFKPVAKTYLGGSAQEVRTGEIETIDDGTIRLRLTVAERGDPACCPSGERRAAFTLEGGQLVEAPTS